MIHHRIIFVLCLLGMITGSVLFVLRWKNLIDDERLMEIIHDWLFPAAVALLVISQF